MEVKQTEVAEFAVFVCEGTYYLSCGPDEIAEVQRGGAFYAEPRQLDETEALELLGGRVPPTL